MRLQMQQRGYRLLDSYRNIVYYQLKLVPIVDSNLQAFPFKILLILNFLYFRKDNFLFFEYYSFMNKAFYEIREAKISTSNGNTIRGRIY